MANFLFVQNLLQGRLGESRARESILLITDPTAGGLRRLAAAHSFPSLSFPGNVAGCFSIFSSAGLFPAAMAGIDIEGRLAGAGFMDQRLQSSPASQNLAYRLAACYYLTLKKRSYSLQVIMPYAVGLTGVADWFCRLWEETLAGKSSPAGAAAPTPVRAAVGAADQYSLGQLCLAGPPGKMITFLEVEKFQHQLPLPSAYPDIDSLNYLSGHTMAALLEADKQALAFKLMTAGCPNLTIKLPEINAFTIGQLLYLWQVAVVALAALLNINPCDQSAAEAGQKTTFWLLGRPGYEAQKEELEKAPSPMKKYIL
jgi:glucose-6-phosphate isomerase